MKKVILRVLSLFMAIVFINLQTFANSYTVASNMVNTAEELAVFDEAEIYDAFNEVDELVSLLETNENITYAELENIDISLVENVSSNAAMALSSTSTDDPPLIGAFWWGCFTGLFPPLGIVGVAVVYFTTKDNHETWKAVGGCVISGLLVGGAISRSGVY